MDLLTPLTASLGELLKTRKELVAVAESSTGGLISAALLAVPGASAFFRGGGVIYTQRSRDELLRLTADMMPGVRSSTEAYARALAARVREQLGVVWGVGETGAAGPAGNRYGDAPGHTCIAIAGPVERVVTVETGQGDREANMWAFARAALELLEAAVRAAG